LVESVVEPETHSEEWYVPEAREKILLLRARGYVASRSQPVYVKSHRRVYGESARTSERMGPRTPQGERRKLPERRHLAGEARGLKISHGVISAIQRMIEFLELPPGWNSYNAKPIRKENVNFAVNLLGRLMGQDTPAPNVIPMVRGGVQLEWHTRGLNVEVSIYSPDDVRFAAEDTRSGREPVEGRLDPFILGQWIDRLSG